MTSKPSGIDIAVSGARKEITLMQLSTNGTKYPSLVKPSS